MKTLLERFRSEIMRISYRDLVLTGSLIVLSFALAFFISSFFFFKSTSKVEKFSFKVVNTFEKPKSNFKVYVSKNGFFKTKVVKNEPTSDYQITDFKLKGTIVCTECGEGMAIIECENKKAKTFKVGDVINGYRLVGVFPKYVQFQKGGRTYRVNIYGSKSKVESSSEHKVFGNKEPFSFHVKREKIIDEISSGKFLRYINIVPNIKNGRTKGMRVRYVSRRSFIHKLGIRPGDVILAINGVEINSPEDSFSAFEQLKNEDTVIITVLRKGKRIDLKYELE
jgi:general secretion pathway protein C